MRQAPADDRARLLSSRDHFRGVRRIRNASRSAFVELVGGSMSQRGEGLVADDRQEPSRYLGTAPEFSGLVPHVPEHLLDHIFRHCVVLSEAQGKAEETYVISQVQQLHRKLVA